MKNMKSVIAGTLLAAALAAPAVWADQIDGAPASATLFYNAAHQVVDGAGNNEVTINKGGTVTFVAASGAHGVAIYPVSDDTVRQDIEEDLCNPVGTCALTTATFSSKVTDGKGDLIIDTDPAFLPANRISYPVDRLLAVGAGAFLALNGEVTYKFEKTGRYLVICMNRNHFINDWMFGFVNVVGGDIDPLP